jgi:hypothetical protein
MHITTPPISDIVMIVPTSLYSSTVSQHLRVHIHAEHGVTLGLLREKLDETLRECRIRDDRLPIRKVEDGPLQEKDFVTAWGKKEHAMFLVQLQPAKDDTAGVSQ